MLVDRLEELLAMMENEDEKEEENQWEDGSALRPWAAPAARTPEKDGVDGPSDMPGELPDVPGGPGAGETDRTVRETAAMDGLDPVWPAEKGVAAVEAARYRDLRERLEETEEGLRTAKANGAQRPDGPTAEAKGGSGTGTGTGLEGLYRQTVRAARPAPQALPVEQAGRTVRAEEPGRTAALTVDELDRAVRRDSRRYDGGMSIF